MRYEGEWPVSEVGKSSESRSEKPYTNLNEEMIAKLAAKFINKIISKFRPISM